jgi:hypothetical protein
LGFVVAHFKLVGGDVRAELYLVLVMMSPSVVSLLRAFIVIGF